MAIGTSDGQTYENELAYHLNHPISMESDSEKVFAKEKYPKDMFDTQLSSEEEAAYQKHFKPQDSEDYDMRGYFKSVPLNDIENRDVNAHYPDTFKKPGHPTFSNESKFHGDLYQGGQWNQLQNGSYTFTPGQENLSSHSSQDLEDYFKRNEPGNKLILPGS